MGKESVVDLTGLKGAPVSETSPRQNLLAQTTHGPHTRTLALLDRTNHQLALSITIVIVAAIDLRSKIGTTARHTVVPQSVPNSLQRTQITSHRN